ncbi:MAG: acyl-CoA dehydrogenase family protein [Gammaproteobacteria bacterium]
MSKDALTAATDMHDLIVANRDETEASRQLARPIVEALIANKLCRVALPAKDGGLELPPQAWFQVYEELAAAEASVAWVAWNNALVCLFARFMSPDVRAEVFGDPDNLFANSTRPSGRAVPDKGAHRVNGRWSLVSGCMHAQWIPVMCLVEKDGAIEMLSSGVPRMLMTVAPRERFEIVDTWHVGGLRGTGSHDAVLTDALVSDEKAFDPFGGEAGSHIDSRLGRTPIASTMSAGCASICLGIARGTHDALVELATSTVSPGPQPDLRDHARTQIVAARTRTRLEALRAHLDHSYAVLWDELEMSASASDAAIARVWSAAITTALECRELVNDMYDVSGTASLYTDSPIERAHRDIHAVLKHIVIQPFWIEQAGRVELGLEPDHPLFAR